MPLTSESYTLKDMQVLLNCKNSLEEDCDWYLAYGLTKKLSDSYMKQSERSKDSFNNPISEKALTLFILGNLDKWKQIGKLRIKPRDRGDKNDWNKEFFEKIKNGKSDELLNEMSANWNKKEIKEMLKSPDKNLEDAILLFEFEIMNSAFNTDTDKQNNGKAFKHLSFLDIGKKRKWSLFDAVLISPGSKRFIFFESKLTSDFSEKTKNYPYINQFIRSLESTFLLTEHENSQYKGWDFRYVFICPRKEYEYKQKLYSYILEDVKDVKKYIDNYKNIIEEYKKYKERYNNVDVCDDCYHRYFEKFKENTANAVSVVSWYDLGELLGGEIFFDAYIKNSEKLVSKKSIIKRLEKAGII